jgi:hypothetical protein
MPNPRVRAPIPIILLVGALALALLGVVSYQFFPTSTPSRAPTAALSKDVGALKDALEAHDERLAPLTVSDRALNQKTQAIVETLNGFKTSFTHLSQQLDGLKAWVATREPVHEADTQAALESLRQQVATLDRRLSTQTRHSAAPAGGSTSRVPPLRVTKIEHWGGTPNVFVEHARFAHRLRLGERVAGWTLRHIVDDGEAVVFQKGDARQRVAVGG